MTTIVWPASIVPAAADYSVEFDVQINLSRSGRIYTFGLPGARWVSTLTFAASVERSGNIVRAATEAMITALRGGARDILAPHFGRPIPNGALRGSPTVRVATAPGNNTVQLQNCNGGVRAGDVFGLGGQLLMVEEDANPSGGNMTVKVSPAIRRINGVGTAWIWNRPTCLWIPRESIAGPFPFLPGNVRPGFSMQFVDIGL